MTDIIILLFFISHPGQYYIEHGFYDIGQRYFEIQSGFDLDNESLLGSAICALAQGELNEAKLKLQRLTQVNIDACLYLGIVDYRMGDYESAMKNLGYYQQYSQNNWPVDYYLGLIRLQSNDIKDALKYFQLISDRPETYLIEDYARNYQLLIKSYDIYYKADYSGAIEMMKSVKYFNNYRLYSMAMSYIAMQDLRNGIIYIDSMLIQSTELELKRMASEEAARICISLKETVKTRNYLMPFLTVNPTNNTFFLVGRSYSDELKYDSAAMYFNQLPDTIDDYLFFKGRTAYFRGLWGLAEEILLCHRQYFPNSIYRDRVLYIIASINFKRKEYEHAIDFWTELINLYPESNLAASAQKGIADAFFENKDFRSALSAYELAKQYQPATNLESEVILRIYETQYYLKKYRSLVDALKSYLAKYPDSKYGLRTRLRIVNLLMEKKDLYACLSEIEHVITVYPDSNLTNQALLEKARVYNQLELPKMVKNIYNDLLKRQPAAEYMGQALSELASIYYQEDSYDSALYYYNKLSNISVYQERAWYEIARIYNNIGQDKESETVIDRLIEKYPTSAFLFDAVFIKTSIYEKRGHYKPAIDLLVDLIDKVGNRPEIYFEIGNIYFQIEDYPGAHKYYLVAAENYQQRRNDVARALLLAGDAMVMIGDKKKALEHFLQAKLIAESAVLKHQLDSKINNLSN